MSSSVLAPFRMGEHELYTDLSACLYLFHEMTLECTCSSCCPLLRLTSHGTEKDAGQMGTSHRRSISGGKKKASPSSVPGAALWVMKPMPQRSSHSRHQTHEDVRTVVTPTADRVSVASGVCVCGGIEQDIAKRTAWTRVSGWGRMDMPHSLRQGNVAVQTGCKSRGVGGTDVCVCMRERPCELGSKRAHPMRGEMQDVIQHRSFPLPRRNM